MNLLGLVSRGSNRKSTISLSRWERVGRGTGVAYNPHPNPPPTWGENKEIEAKLFVRIRRGPAAGVILILAPPSVI